MRLLIDNQLPETLGRFLNENGFECTHVRRVGLRMASDAAIWDYAVKHRMAIVTVDDDFVEMAAQRPGSGSSPQIVWVRLGNMRKLPLIEAFKALLPSLKEALSLGHSIVEIR